MEYRSTEHRTMNVVSPDIQCFGLRAFPPAIFRSREAGEFDTRRPHRPRA